MLRFLLLLVTALMLTACGGSSDPTPTATAVAAPTATFLATPAPIALATAVPTVSAVTVVANFTGEATVAIAPTSTAPVANDNANLRAGPGTDYAIVGTASQGDALEITGRADAGDWYQLISGAWIFAPLVANAPTNLPVAGTRAMEPVDIIQPTPVLPDPLVPTPTPTSAPSRTSSGGSLVIVSVDKGAEFAVIRNDSGEAINLSGWTLLSEKGDQACPLSGVIESGATLTISALGDVAGFNCGLGGNIWNNSDPDPAALIAPDGSVVSRFVE